MYSITSSIHIHFAHHVRGHSGPCISLHGHTWLFEITLESETLDEQGFVVDFDIVSDRVLAPCHRLLDHSLALGEASWRETREALAKLGNTLVDSRRETLGDRGTLQPMLEEPLAGARNERPGDIKVAVFPFTPTSERLAEWLFDLTRQRMGDDRVGVRCARIYEALAPTQSIAEYAPPPRH